MDQILCVLTKLSTNANNLRTNEVKGFCTEEPKIGEQFLMTADSLTPEANIRVVITSPIQKLAKKETVNSKVIYEIETLNSSYRVELYP